MKSLYPSLILSLALPFILVDHSHAQVMVLTDSTPTVSANFSDGSNDYFGIVDAGGTTINGTSFTPNDTTPVVGSVAGRDIDDGAPAPFIAQTAVWGLSIPVGTTSIDTIDFTGTLAASDEWINNAFLNSIDFVLNVGGVDVLTESYRTQNAVGGPITSTLLALDTNGDDVGDGTVIQISGTGINLTDAGGSSAAILNNPITLTASFRAFSSGTDFWTTGTLSANATVVPEPGTIFGTTAAVGFGLFLFMRERKKRQKQKDSELA